MVMTDTILLETMASREVFLESKLRMFVWRTLHVSDCFTLFEYPTLPLLIFFGFLLVTTLILSDRGGVCSLAMSTLFDGSDSDTAVGFSGDSILGEPDSPCSDSIGVAGDVSLKNYVFGFDERPAIQEDDEIYKSHLCYKSHAFQNQSIFFGDALIHRRILKSTSQVY